MQLWHDMLGIGSPQQMKLLAADSQGSPQLGQTYQITVWASCMEPAKLTQHPCGGSYTALAQCSRALGGQCKTCMTSTSLALGKLGLLHEVLEMSAALAWILLLRAHWTTGHGMAASIWVCAWGSICAIRLLAAAAAAAG